MTGKQRIALITGASSGLGKQYVRALSNDTQIDAFWVIARRKDRLELLRQYTAKPVYVLPLDLTKTQTFPILEQLLAQQNVQVQTLIANAGMGLIKDTKETTIAEADRMIDLNIKAVVHCIRLCLPYMLKGSNILIVGSMSAFQPLPGFNIYASTKAFLRSYSYGLHEELRPMGIHVTCLYPYWIQDTEFISIAQSSASSSYGTNLFPSNSAQVVKQSLKDLYRNRAVSTPGLISSSQRVLTHLLPAGMIARFMNQMKK